MVEKKESLLIPCDYGYAEVYPERPDKGDKVLIIPINGENFVIKLRPIKEGDKVITVKIDNEQEIDLPYERILYVSPFKGKIKK